MLSRYQYMIIIFFTILHPITYHHITLILFKKNHLIPPFLSSSSFLIN